MRALRILALVFAILVAIALAAVVAITQLVDANRLKPQIEAAVRDATGQSLQLRGNIKLNFFPWLALQSEQGEFAPPLARWQSMSVRARLVPLLRGQLQVDRVRLDGLVLRLQKNADGTNNWSGFVAPQQTPVTPAAPPALAGLDLINATIDYRDLASHTHFRAEKLQLTSGVLAPGRAIDLQLAGDLRVGAPAAAAGPPVLHASLTGQWQLADSKMSFSAIQATGLLRAANLNASGVAWQISVPLVTYEPATADTRLASGVANFAGVRVAVANVRFRAGADPAAKRSGTTATGTTAAASGAVHLTTATLRDSLRTLGATLPATTDPNALGALSGDLSFDLRDGIWSIADMTVRIDDTQLRGNVSAATSPFQFTLHGDRVNVDRYLSPASVPAKPWEFPAAVLRDLQAQGSVLFDQAEYQGYALRNAKLEFILHDGTLRSVESQTAPPEKSKQKRKP